MVLLYPIVCLDGQCGEYGSIAKACVHDIYHVVGVVICMCAKMRTQKDTEPVADIYRRYKVVAHPLPASIISLC